MISSDEIETLCRAAIQDIVNKAGITDDGDQLENVTCIFVKMQSLCAVQIAVYHDKDVALLCMCDTIAHLKKMPERAN